MILALLVTALVALADPAQGRTCYLGSSTSPKLPTSAVNVTLTDEEGSACTKVYKMEKMYSTATGELIETKVTYTWAAKVWVGKKLVSQRCGDAIEEGYMSSIPGTEAVSHVYQRWCTCCGDNCNGPEMDEKCNEEPLFTHMCYANDRMEEPKRHLLPENARGIQCTANQRCYKSAALEQIGVYTWGCAFYPSSGDYCGKTFVYYHPAEDGTLAHYDKVCTCCGHFCNGEGLDGAVFNNTYCGPPVAPKRSCYVGTSDSPNLPADAKNYTLATMELDTSACAKIYQMEKEYNLVTGEYLGTKTSYMWIHKSLAEKNLIPQNCGDAIEESYIRSTAPRENVTRHYYIRHCTCCGQNCNGNEMNSKCNAEPKFTHECFSNDRSKYPRNALLPVESQAVQCTEAQKCFKSSVVEHAGYYTWGCAAYPSSGAYCGKTYSYHHPATSGPAGRPAHWDKVCTCCGHLCNGHDFDTSTINNTNCGLKRSCFSGGSTSGKLPDDAKNYTSSSMDRETSACAKLYQTVREYNMITGAFKGTKTSYTWLPIELTGTNLIPKSCGDVIEESYMSTAPGINMTRHYYQRYCTCCGENCNGPQMDDKCNEEPQFTHKCYSNDRSRVPPSYTLPPGSQEVLCTENQTCFKSATADHFGTYNWGCASYPSAGGKCGDSFTYEHPATPGIDGKPAHIDKVCTCCGTRCNGPDLDGAQFNNTYCGPALRTCYNAYLKKSSKLPEDAFKHTEPFLMQSDSACVKVFERSYEFNTTTGEFLNSEVTYNWYAKDFFQPKKLVPERCGDIVEESDLRYQDDDLATVYYRRYCSCCGDNCNGRDMDVKCNEEPEFTHQCYADDRSRSAYNTDPEMPRTALPVYCTANQKCYKSAIDHEDEDQIYHWGCASYPSVANGTTKLLYKHPADEYVDAHIDKICLCDGHLCNMLFDEVKSNNEFCPMPATTTTTPELTTTPGGAIWFQSGGKWVYLSVGLAVILAIH